MHVVRFSISGSKFAGKMRKSRSVTASPWIVLYFFVVFLWGAVLFSTVQSEILKRGLLIDTEIDLTYVTVPMLAFNLIFLASTLFIFATFLIWYGRTKRMQLNTKDSCHAAGHGVVNYPDSLSDHSQLCSIIIPARNEESVIRRTVLSCLQQTYKNIEVVVVCHNPSDRTFEEAQVVDKRVRVFNLRTEQVGKGIALNYGVKMARGNYLLILDADGLLSKNFIEDVIPMFAENYAAVQGRYIPSNRNYNFVTRMLALEGDLWSAPFMTCRDFIGKRCPLGGTGYIIRKDILIEVGMFANHLVDDYELTFRLLRNRYRIGYAPLSINYDEKPPTLDFMIKQRARWVRGFLNLLRLRLAEPRDVIGNLYWLNPISAFTGLVLLLISGYSAVHNLLYDYYPYEYGYISFELWLVINAITVGLYTAALVRQYGRIGLRYAAWLPLYIPFSNYYLVIGLKAFFVKSWADTKTVHGFVLEVPASERLFKK